MGDQEARVLRRRLQRHESGRGKRYPAELRERVVAWATSRGASGISVRESAAEIGVRAETLRRWLVAEERGSRSVASALVPVELVASSVDERDGDALRVETPGGYQVVGLTFGEVVLLLRVLP